jgi:tetratricopeptide (TPR) repeat protein
MNHTPPDANARTQGQPHASQGRRTRAGGAKKLPTRYTEATPSPPLREALWLHKKLRHHDAIARYIDALALDPASLDAVMNLAAAYVVVGRARPAIALYERGTTLGANVSRALRDAGIGLAAVGEHDRAIAALTDALALDDAMVGARLSLSRVLGEAGRSIEALAQAERAVEQRPDDPSTHLELHRACFDDGATARATQCAERAFALDPTSAQARLCYAGALAMTKGAGLPSMEDLVDDATVVAPGLADALRHALSMRRGGCRAFAYKRATIERAAQSATLDGPALEFGVRHGVSTRVLAERFARVTGFDSFEGLPEPWQGREAGAFSTSGEPPALPAHVALKVGRFEDTLPGFVQELRDAPPSLVHVDSDLYSSARCALFALGPWIRPGCVLLFDEYLANARWREDEFRAMTEASERFRWQTEPIAVSWITGQAALRVTHAG